MGILNYVWAGGLTVVLLLFGWQELSLRHANSVLSATVVSEIRCLKGSNCAVRLAQESASGAALVTAARAEADTQLVAQKAALDKQAADAVQSLQQEQAAVQRSLVDTQAKLAAAEAASTDCATWSKQVTRCDIR